MTGLENRNENPRIDAERSFYRHVTDRSSGLASYQGSYEVLGTSFGFLQIRSFLRHEKDTGRRLAFSPEKKRRKETSLKSSRVSVPFDPFS